MAKRSKRYRALAGKIPSAPVPLDEAVQLLKTFGNTKFDQTVDASFRLGVDPKQADQSIRGAISLPHGTGKTVRIAVFAKGDNETAAKEAGADVVGGEDLAKRIKEGFLDFDLTLATPDMMGVVGPLGRVLGPKGLMPTPKNGTVTSDIGRAVREFKAGKVEYRMDANGNLHVRVGKLSFAAEKLVDNIRTLAAAVRAARPASVKGTFIQSVTVSATMSPGVRVAV